jgi:cation diffusion facilitator family transporter
MSSECGHHGHSADHAAARFRRALWIALALNAAMFFVEIVSGWRAGSVSLLADAVDFFGDAVSYGVSLYVLSLHTVWRSRTALAKGWVMGGYGLFVLAQAALSAVHGIVPQATTMGVVGGIALLVNVTVAVLLYAHREGDANMRSVWLCTRNDAIGNLAVLVAALGVFGTGSGWPDLIVAAIMGTLALMASRSVIAHARQELRGESRAG